MLTSGGSSDGAGGKETRICMYDLIQTMLGQEVIVYVSDGSVSTVGGFLRKVEEG